MRHVLGVSFALRAILLGLVVLLAPRPTAGDEVGQGVARGPLDGMAFVGKIGPAENPDVADVLYFRDGHFWSKACTLCGFAPAPYWVRYVEDGIEFRGVLESPDRGRFSYSGIVRDGRLTAAINWRHDRWYWSVDRDLRFEGVRSEDHVAAMTLEAARSAAGAEAPRPDGCPS
jgi:hypothetical protein